MATTMTYDTPSFWRHPLRCLRELVHHMRLLAQFRASLGPAGPMGLDVLATDGRVYQLVAQPRIGERAWEVTDQDGRHRELPSRDIRAIYNAAFEAGYDKIA